MGKEEKKTILIGDVGGTKTLLILTTKKGEVVREKVYKNKEFSSFSSIIDEFLVDIIVEKAVIGVAGPVFDGMCKMTNLSWIVCEKEIEKNSLIKHATVMNDLELAGYGLKELKNSDLITVCEGDREKNGVKLLVSVGTGLGEAMITEKKVFATEGGHCDYAAFTKEEIDFLVFMKNKYEHISYEKVLSGQGIKNIYEFFSGNKDLSAKEIFSRQNKDALNTRRFFFMTLGKEVANFALKTLPCGGVFLSGGVIKKNSDHFLRDCFLKGFFSKGGFNSLLEKIPVYIIKGKQEIVVGGLKYNS